MCQKLMPHNDLILFLVKICFRTHNFNFSLNTLSYLILTCFWNYGIFCIPCKPFVLFLSETHRTPLEVHDHSAPLFHTDQFTELFPPFFFSTFDPSPPT